MSGENEHGPTCNPQERDYLQKLLVSARSKERSSTDFYSFGKVHFGDVGSIIGI